MFRPRVQKLFVGNRDCTALVDGALRQADVVREILGSEIPVQAILCFIEADWPLLGGYLRTRGVLVLKPRKLYAELHADGPLEIASIDELYRTVASRLVPA